MPAHPPARGESGGFSPISAFPPAGFTSKAPGMFSPPPGIPDSISGCTTEPLPLTPQGNAQCSQAAKPLRNSISYGQTAVFKRNICKRTYSSFPSTENWSVRGQDTHGKPANKLDILTHVAQDLLQLILLGERQLNPSRQLRPAQPLAHSPSRGVRRRI